MARPFLLGLTGSIGMGKSTTAAMFAEAGAALWDADAAVHRLYAPGGAAVPAVAALVPGASAGGAVDRAQLRAALARDPGLLARLEAAVHPLVAADRAAFLAAAERAGQPVVVLDVPLLYETGGERGMDATVVVSAPAEVQRARVLARPGMTAAQLDAILARQMPDAEKRRRATWVIETTTPEVARAAVGRIMDEIAARRVSGHA
ncbi:MAG: dephospho-CoA kinase [Rhodobacteraceae bacterium]|jgi:dephospho-CoA kinase|nr:dephospho-CoA kinase [Paracoccaceae bacterium]